MIDGIYQNNKKVNYITIRQSSNGIKCIMVDSNGSILNNGSLFTIDMKTGAIKLHNSISDKFGFTLDPEGRLNISFD